MSNRNYYMVRAMFSREEHFNEFFKNNVICVGWSDLNFSERKDILKLREAVKNRYYNNQSKSLGAISRKLNEVERFKNIKKGDYIIVPYNSYIAIAEAGEREIYSIDAKSIDLANQREVTYRYENGRLLTIPRDELSEGLQRRLRVRGNTVANLYEFKDEIEKIFSRKSYSFSSEIQSLE